MATTEPVVLRYGREAGRRRWRRGAAVSRNGLLGGLRYWWHRGIRARSDYLWLYQRKRLVRNRSIVSLISIGATARSQGVTDPST